MISQELIIMLFTIAFILIFLNLMLTFRLVKAVNDVRAEIYNPQPLQTGEVIPSLEAQRLLDECPFEYQLIRDQAKVFLYLSSDCPKCKSKLPEIEGLVHSAQESGVSIWLFTDEKPKKIKQFLRGTSLYGRTLGLDQKVLNLFNPVNASPFYLFVDQSDILQAQGLIGDENWLQFSQQITEH